MGARVEYTLVAPEYASASAGCSALILEPISRYIIHPLGKFSFFDPSLFGARISNVNDAQ